MNVLLFSMPDSFEHTPSLTMRMPNGALASLAGNVDPHHRVAVADLVLAQDDVPGTVRRLVRDVDPQVVGLSVMTFQRHTARRIVALVRALRPDARIVVGGYDPSLAPQIYEGAGFDVDAIVLGEGEITFRELLRAYEGHGRLPAIDGLSYRDGDRFVRTPRRPVRRDLDAEIRPPNRAARVLRGYTFLGRPIDIVETSRGCTYDCTFCSIIEMRGRNFETWSIDRVVADIADARARGARTIFIVDDNVTLNASRFRRICDAIAAAGLNDVDYLVQGMTSAVAAGGDELAAAMRRAGFRYVFLGIENVIDQDLGFLGARAKNAAREHGRTVGSATMRAVTLIRRHGMFVVGGLIVGNPDDTREAIEANLAFARRFVDWPYIQHPTPYPGTPMTRDFAGRGLIVDHDVEAYDGTTAVVKTTSMEAEEIEFMRWRAERWMKARHFPPVLVHDPWFVGRHAIRMMRHTFRGMRLRTWLGLEPQRDAFRRYKRLRQRERQFFAAEDERASSRPFEPAGTGASIPSVSREPATDGASAAGGSPHGSW
ncbi:MAG: B12-binding domain-containing radical SAM protein [Acidobacteria bacterium]|nr:B12-binding domain-containing radical SAM protein [Acidobacteriota bacterium]